MGNCFLLLQHLCSLARQGRESQDLTMGIQGTRIFTGTLLGSHSEEEDVYPELNFGQKIIYAISMAFYRSMLFTSSYKKRMAFGTKVR